MNKQESVLSYLLSKAGKTFKDLANYVGVEESTPYRWARGTRTPEGRIWREVQSFLEEECGFDLQKILPYGSSFSKYLALPMDSCIGDDLMCGVEKFYKAKEVGHSKIKYIGNQFAQGGRLCEESHEPNEETKAALDECTADRLSRGGNKPKNGLENYLDCLRDAHGYEVELPKRNLKEALENPDCIQPILERKITELIEDQFREFLGRPQGHQQFIELVDCYGRYFNMTRQNL